MKRILFKNIEQFITKELKIKKEDLEYTLLKNKLFESTILNKYKPELIRSEEGIKLLFGYLNNYSLDWNKIIDNKDKKLYLDLKEILLNSESYKEAKKNINDCVFNFETLNKIKIEKDYNYDSILSIFTDKSPDVPNLNEPENDILYKFHTYSKQGDTKDLLSSNYEIFLKRTNLYNKKENESININEDYQYYSNFINELFKELPENNILKIISSSNNAKEAEEKLFEITFPEIKRQIINKINLLITLKTKEDLYIKNNIEEYYEKTVNKFPEILSPLDCTINEYKTEVNQFTDILKKDQIEFLNNECNNLNFSNILSKKQFDKIFNLYNFQEYVYIPEFVSERITIEKINNIEYDYKLILNYNKLNNTAYPAFLFINESLEEYEKSIKHLMDYLSKNKIELSNINNSFKPQLTYYFDDFESYVESYNSDKNNDTFIYWSESNSKLKAVLTDLNIKDYDSIKKIYLKFNNYNYEDYNKSEIINFLVDTKIEKNRKLDI